MYYDVYFVLGFAGAMILLAIGEIISMTGVLRPVFDIERFCNHWAIICCILLATFAHDYTTMPGLSIGQVTLNIFFLVVLSYFVRGSQKGICSIMSVFLLIDIARTSYWLAGIIAFLFLMLVEYHHEDKNDLNDTVSVCA